MNAIVFVNGELANPPAVGELLQPGDLLIAADGGARLLEAMGRCPDVLVGDLDSIDPALVSAYQRRGVRIERHPVHKDQTDLELALEFALTRNPESILIVGAGGGRLDHTLANILILAQRTWPVPIWINDGMQQATLVRGPARFDFITQPGRTVSMIPLSEQVTGVTYEGFEYPLVNATLELGSTRGISNRALHGPVAVEVKSGLLLIVIQPREGPIKA